MSPRAAIPILALMSLTAQANNPDSLPSGAPVFDGRWQLGDTHQLVTELRGTADKYSPIDAARASSKERRFGGDALVVRWTFDSGKWFAKANLNQSDDMIRAGTDFARHFGSRNTELVLGRVWNGDTGDWLGRKKLQTSYQATRSNNGQTLADRYSAEFGVTGPKQSQIHFKYLSGREFQIGKLIDFDRLTVTGRVKPQVNVEMGFDSLSGDTVDRSTVRLANQDLMQPFVSWKIHKHVSLRLNDTHLDLETETGEEILDARLINAELSWQISDIDSVQMTLQQQEIERNPEAYVASIDIHSRELGQKLMYSRKLNSKTDFQLSYADAYVNSAQIDVPSTAGRSWFMSIGYRL